MRGIAGLALLVGVLVLLATRAPVGEAGSVAGTAAVANSLAGSGAALSPRADGSAGSEAGAVASGQRAGLGPSVDLARVVEQVHYAFRRQEDGSWNGGHTTYDVKLRDGAMEVTPYHHPQRGPGEIASAEPRHRAPVPDVPSTPEPQEPVEGDAVRFAPAVVARGGAVLSAAPAVERNGDVGQLEIVRGPVVEQLRNGPEGVEQSWRYAGAPEGSGDLEVRIPVESGRLVGETDGGLHLTAGKLGVRYGHATWIDALGVKTPVAARWADGQIALRVPAAVVDGSVYPAILDPVIGPEVAMDAPVLRPAADAQSYPAVASDGADYLIVWQDHRSGTNWDIYGARVSGAGVVQDVSGIAISTAASGQYYPAVAHGGNDYLVAWQDARNGGYDIYGARVSGAGVVRDASGVAISRAAGDQYAPGVSSDGTTFLVVWQDYRGTSSDVYGARVSGAGVVQDSNGIAIATASTNAYAPAVAWGGARYLVAWHDDRNGSTNYDVYGARVSGDGVVQDAAGIAVSTAAGNQYCDAVAWDGTDFLVVWTDARSGEYDVYGARVSGEGVVQDPAGIGISTLASSEDNAAVAWDGTDFLVVWEDRRSGMSYDVYGARVSGDGVVQDPGGLAISTGSREERYPAVASNGTDDLVAWADPRNGGVDDVYAARLSAAGVVQDAAGLAVSSTVDRESNPAISWDGTNYLVVWDDHRALANDDVYGVRVSGAGVVLDPVGIAISSAGREQTDPAVASDGSGWLVVWTDFRSGSTTDVYGARVSGEGVVQDATGIAISTAASNQYAGAVAWDGTDYLVVWTDFRNGAASDVYGARVSAAGAVQDPAGIAVSARTSAESNPALAWGGTGYLVVWEDQRNGFANSDIYGARVTGAGVVQDAAGIAISSANAAQYYPAVAWDGADYLVAWQDLRNGNSDVYGARVSGAGSVRDPSGIAITTAAGDQEYPRVAWDGIDHLVVWQDRRAGSWDVYGARVASDGTVQEPGGIALADSTSDETLPDVASSGSDHFLLAYAAYDASLGTGRIRGRTVSLAVPNAPPTANAFSATTAEDAAVGITLTGSDLDGDPLTLRVVTPPTHGVLTGSGASLTYTPEANFNGSDAFTFVANDGVVDSAPATVSLTVTAVNDPPVASGQSVTTGENSAVAVTLGATDVDGDLLVFRVASPPVHGALTGSGASLTYTPETSFHGTDAFTFVANDGTVDSAPATVSITVTEIAPPPATNASGGCGCTMPGDGAPLGAVLFVLLGFRPGRRRLGPGRADGR